MVTTIHLLGDNGEFASFMFILRCFTQNFTGSSLGALSYQLLHILMCFNHYGWRIVSEL